MPLGIVPVHEDGSAHFLAPVERELMFQVLDENFMAVQTMRSVTYVHRGEHLTCVGCHESPRKSIAPPSSTLQALRIPRPGYSRRPGPWNRSPITVSCGRFSRSPAFLAITRRKQGRRT